MSSVSATMSRHERRKANTAHRNASILAMYNTEYHQNRTRFDDVIDKIATTYALSKATIERILTGKR